MKSSIFDFHLVTVCVDNYPVLYANKLFRRLREVSSLKYGVHCITDKPREFSDTVHTIPRKLSVPGWWTKVQLFDNKSMPDEWVVYMDLDIVILKSFDDIIYDVLQNGDKRKIYAVSDAITWKGNRFSSSFMMFHPRYHKNIWKTFEKDHLNIIRYDGGDQVWIGKEMSPNVEFLDDKYPHLKKNLKFHLGKKIQGSWTFPLQIPGNICMVDCGGRPKPHDLESLPYIKQNWHDVI